MPHRLSLIIPTYNEEDSIEPLYREIATALDSLDQPAEVIFVDDCSFDRTSERIEALRVRDPRVRNIRLARNSGKSAGYAAGFAAARGELVATIDADLQDDIAELPKMLAKIDEGYDLVIGWRKGRFKNEPLKAVPSVIFNLLLFVFFGVRFHDSNCGFRVMARSVAKTLKLYGGFYRFIPELAHSMGFRVAEVGVNHRHRRFGVSKYGPVRFWTGVLDIISVRFVITFIDRPLQFFGTLSMLAFLVGAAIEGYVLTMKLRGETFQEHVAAIIIGAMFILVAFQVLTTGFIGEMIAARLEGHAVRDAQEIGADRSSDP